MSIESIGILQGHHVKMHSENWLYNILKYIINRPKTHGLPLLINFYQNWEVHNLKIFYPFRMISKNDHVQECIQFSSFLSFQLF